MAGKARKKTRGTPAGTLKDLGPRSQANVKGGKTLTGKAKIIDGRYLAASGQIIQG